MVTLGLGKIVPMLRKPAVSGIETLSEIVERLKPSAAITQALSETVAWCLDRSPLHKRFRSAELDPSTLLEIPHLNELGIELWLERKRMSYQLAIDAINANRSAFIRNTDFELVDPAVLEFKGRLLLYEPLETVTDGASEASSRGFFDIEDAPPWDTWFLYSSGSIICWIPEAMIDVAQAGVSANPVDCIRCVTGESCEFGHVGLPLRFSPHLSIKLPDMGTRLGALVQIAC